MENLYIEGTHGTYFVPTVDFNANSGRCEISGESYLENTRKFYEPLLQWIETFVEEESKPIYFNIKLTYFNTSSSRALLDMLNLLKEYEDRGGQVRVNWYHNVDDDDMIEEIEDYILDTGLDIKMKPM